ncbi:Altered inheritance of mitochondria 23, mitochondrial [Melia azedarach]|uniref:Altered inheritance of mitochondria 23, mitochondrial n=1 Tax=Melia azedarach TaxID=155640 RepID=A0ACC1XZQ6_MELAZ|nr:Altered inheritance of mitochondria 23, mitochondrial [Melia azedarach]
MAEEKEERTKEVQIQNPNPNNNNNNDKDTSQNKILKGKSCKGCLYYSSALKSNSQNPVCVGIPRNLQQVPRYIVGETELEASKEGRTLKDFKYGCVGYSVFLDNKDSSTDMRDHKEAELPFCVGLEVLLDRSPSTADHVPAHMRKSEESYSLPQPRSYKPAPFPGDEYWSKFKRNAGLVASGVAKNVNKVSNHIKETLEDILYPYRRK